MSYQRLLLSLFLNIPLFSVCQNLSSNKSEKATGAFGTKTFVAMTTIEFERFLFQGVFLLLFKIL